jgi:lipopolysaccharide transport system ATP-binding protein
MSDIAVSVSGIGKRYTINGARNQSSLAEQIQRYLPFGRPRAAVAPELTLAEDATEFWALRDVSLEVPEGEVLGILGRNGSGKSTLMKILARITAPTTGTVRMTGRIGAMLEVGTGFHPDFTGRENIFLNGAILGLPRAEIARHIDEIIEFSEIGAFIDNPVKRYSSGMFLRLAFSVLAHLDADVMLIDEITAVGDAGFARKSLDKIRQMVRSGRTVLFISHDMEAVRQLCDRCIVLDHGRIQETGEVDRCIRTYEALSRSQPVRLPIAAVG